MRTLIEHGLVLAGPGLEPKPDAVVAIEDGVIKSVGAPPPGWVPEVKIDAAGMAVLPGLINAHTHAAMTLFRGFSDDLPLQEWLESILPREAHLTGAHVYWGTLLAAVEMIRTGTTAFADMYFYLDEIAQAVEEAGMRACLSYGMVGLDPAKAERELATGLAFARKYRGAAGGRLSTMLAPHAPYTCPDGFLREVIAAAAAEDLSIHIHVSETERENREMIERTGKTPAAHLEEIGLFERPVLLAHGVWLTPADIGIISRRRVGVAHCPGSNLKLASGIAPVTELVAAGVPVGLGTDGAASNNNLDLLREVHLAALVHKVRERSATVVPAATALRLATAGGAEVMGLKGSLGILAPGYRADLIFLDLDRPHLVPAHNIVSHLVYAAEGYDVTDVMVEGRFLLRNGQFTQLDEERIIREAGRLGLELCR